MLKRKQQLDVLEAERREYGSGEEDFEDISSSGSEYAEASEIEDAGAESGAEDTNQPPTQGAANGPGKTKVMLLASRGVTSRQRHMMNDLHLILPHSKRESKFDGQGSLMPLNELAELNDCTHTLFLEHKKPDDLYLWLAKTPSGPSIRFHVENIHTLDELSFAGNCMIGSRPIVSFDDSLSKSEHGTIIQKLLASVFGTPLNSRKAKPYFDHIFHFGVADGRIWFRNYQIVEASEKTVELQGLSLIEIGPRFVLNPVRLFSGSFGGPTIWSNENFMTTAAIRAKERRNKAGQHIQRLTDVEATVARKKAAHTEPSEIDKVFDN